LEDGYSDFAARLQYAYSAIERFQRNREDSGAERSMIEAIVSVNQYLSQFKPYIPAYKQRFFEIVEHHDSLGLSTRDLIMTFDRAVYELHTRLEKDHRLADDLGNWSPLMTDLLNNRREIEELADREDGREAEDFVTAGLTVVGGWVRGAALKIESRADWSTVAPGSIILARMTTPDIILAIEQIAGIVTEQGGRVCHAAVLAREYGIPCVVGCGRFMDGVEQGTMLVLDASSGILLQSGCQS